LGNLIDGNPYHIIRWVDDEGKEIISVYRSNRKVGSLEEPHGYSYDMHKNHLIIPFENTIRYYRVDESKIELEWDHYYSQGYCTCKINDTVAVVMYNYDEHSYILILDVTTGAFKKEFNTMIPWHVNSRILLVKDFILILFVGEKGRKYARTLVYYGRAACMEKANE
jgi:hypothetical protein